MAKKRARAKACAVKTPATATKKRRTKKKRETLPGEIVGEMNGFPVRRVKVSDLTPAGYNPRTIDDESLDGLKKSTSEFGVVQPVIWNERTQTVVGGHQRLKTMDPDSTTDVVVVDLDEAREKALNVALNNPNTMGDWTTGLGDILKQISVEIPDLASGLRLDMLSTEVERLGSFDLGPIDDVDLGDEDSDEGEEGDDGPNSPSDTTARNKLIWSLEIVFDSEQRRNNALKALRDVGGDTLADSLESLLEIEGEE